MPRIRYINRNVSPEMLYDRFEIQIQYISERIFELAAIFVYLRTAPMLPVRKPR